MGHSIAVLLVHIVFATRRRERVIGRKLGKKLEGYMVGVARQLGGRAIAVAAEPEHCHLLAEIPRTMPVAELASKLKSNSSRFAKAQEGSGPDFGWQEGYMAVTVSPRDKARVISYINNQAEHHRKKSFDEECGAWLSKLSILLEEIAGEE